LFTIICLVIVGIYFTSNIGSEWNSKIYFWVFLFDYVNYFCFQNFYSISTRHINISHFILLELFRSNIFTFYWRINRRLGDFLDPKELTFWTAEISSSACSKFVNQKLFSFLLTDISTSACSRFIDPNSIRYFSQISKLCFRNFYYQNIFV